MTSIEESLLKIADKVDPDNKVEVSPNNLNPNYSIQRSLERIADSDLGGGGVTYVIPEQTVTFPSSGTGVQLSDIGSLNELNDGEQVIIKMTRDGEPENEALYVPATYYDGTIEGSAGGGSSTILVTKDGSNWKISYNVGVPIFPLTATISAIKGF